VAVMVPFTSNYNDLSTDFGYQFEFRCQRCGNGYQSSFQKSSTDIGSSVLRAAGGLFGGFFGTASNAGQTLADLTRGPAHDRALGQAVDEMRPHFTQCHRCGEWVCKAICWNEATGLCTNCSPKIQQEVAAAQAEAKVSQVREKLAATDLTEGLDLHQPAVAICPSCHQETQSGKFCSNCGKPLTATMQCPNCHSEVKAGAKFCPECGKPL
jgi:hypothetical protein